MGTSLTGPESWVQNEIKKNSTAFFPLGKCIKTESSEGSEAHKEREAQVKDLDDFKATFRNVADNTDSIRKSEQAFKSELRDLRESVMQQTTKIQTLQQMLTPEDEVDKKKKKKG